jgi:hypothetical protein
MGVAEDLPDGTTAVIIAWENTWAVRLQPALADAGGLVILHERIDPQDVTVAFEAIAITEDA